jgi:6-phosphofructokinase 1
MKKVGVFTSGGDAPGMNAAIRAVVRCGNAQGVEVWGIHSGHRGLIENKFNKMDSRSVGNIIQRGGTILGTARCKEFKTEAGLKQAVRNLEQHGVEGLVAIGGDGTYRGMIELLKVWKGHAVGVPGTIDNDIYGTDETIGFNTAINTALEAIDKIRDTADAHERFFIVEVMGRHAGFIALNVAIGGGAEEMIIPEVKTDLKAIAEHMREGREGGKRSSIVVVAEGNDIGGAAKIAEELKKLSGFDYRVVILGHIQRGGSPTALDRRLATKLGAFAIELLSKGTSGVAAGELNGKRVATSLEDTVSKKKELDAYLQKLVPILSR